MIIGKSAHAAVETTATTTEQNVPFDVDYIFCIANDGTSEIYLNFDALTTDATKITVKPGELINEFPRNVKTLYYRASVGSQPFRVWGVK